MLILTMLKVQVLKALCAKRARNASRYCGSLKRLKLDQPSRFFVLSCPRHVRLCIFFYNSPLRQYFGLFAGSVSRFTVAQAVPHLVKVFLSPDELPNRAPTTVLLAELVTAARDSMAKSPDNTSEVFVLPFKDEVLGVFVVGIAATSTRLPALAGIEAMVTTPGLLTDDELGFIVHNVDGILQADPDEDDARPVM